MNSESLARFYRLEPQRMDEDINSMIPSKYKVVQIGRENDSHHDADLVVIDGTVCCHNNNLQYHK